MNWIELASAVGVGTVVAKVVDLKLLQPFLLKRERSVWLREKRLDAFSRLTQNILAFGLEEHGELKSPFEHYAVAADALLLIDSRTLCNKIDQFLVKREAMERAQDSGNDQEATKLYHELNAEGRAIVAELRSELRDDQS